MCLCKDFSRTSVNCASCGIDLRKGYSFLAYWLSYVVLYRRRIFLEGKVIRKYNRRKFSCTRQLLRCLCHLQKPSSWENSPTTPHAHPIYQQGWTGATIYMGREWMFNQAGTVRISHFGILKCACFNSSCTYLGARGVIPHHGHREGKRMKHTQKEAGAREIWEAPPAWFTKSFPFFVLVFC